MHPTSLPSFDRLMSRAGQLYSLPSVAAELVRLTDAPQVDASAIRRAVGTKWAGHQINQVTFVRPRRSMSQIGG